MPSPSTSNILPISSNDCELANQFKDFFANKINHIKSKVSGNVLRPSGSTNEILLDTSSRFSCFEVVSEESVRKVIMASPSSSCSLDPIPVNLLKRCIDALLPIITRIVNMSLQSGLFPDSLKQAQIRPLIKKAKLEKNDLQNYRPIANLKFLAKTVERLCTSQIQTYLHSHNLNGYFQSAYRRNHSTETGLLRVYNDLLLSIDKGEEAVLVLLDFSAAFDTIDHNIFFKRLQRRYGINDSVLKWFKSYFINRSQVVVINGKESDVHIPTEGVPQGSVIGPLSFILYTSPIEDIIRFHDMNGMIYADDTQIYAFKAKGQDLDNVLCKLDKCIKDIRSWSLANGLMLNDLKSEVLHMSSKFRSVQPLQSIEIGTERVFTAQEARNLGVIFDDKLSMSKQVNSICRSASLALHKIGQIRQYLDQPTTELLVHAFVSSRLDNCNSLLYGLPKSLLAKLQHIQNSAARLVTRKNSFTHITPVLHSLHWLPVVERINFKILLLTYQCMHRLAPTYLIELINDYNPPRSLRSTSKSLLTQPSVKTNHYGCRSFQYASAHLWNNLPCKIKQATSVAHFKSLLKTHLFLTYFS